jgi:hypothetical protein
VVTSNRPTSAAVWADAMTRFVSGPLTDDDHTRVAAAPDLQLRRIWAERTDLPGAVVQARLQVETDAGILIRLLTAATTVPTEVLTRLAGHDDRGVSAVAALTPGCPDQVAAAALRRLRTRHRFWLQQHLMGGLLPSSDAAALRGPRSLAAVTARPRRTTHGLYLRSHDARV